MIDSNELQMSCGRWGFFPACAPSCGAPLSLKVQRKPVLRVVLHDHSFRSPHPYTIWAADIERNCYNVCRRIHRKHSHHGNPGHCSSPSIAWHRAVRGTRQQRTGQWLYLCCCHTYVNIRILGTGSSRIQRGINISIRNHRFTGAKKLADMGFHPSGSTLPLIMITGDDGDISDKKYLAEERTQKLLEDLQLERARDIEIALHPDMWKWNLRMILITALCCFLSILPYIYLNIEGNDEINMSARWMFPATRALGGFLTASMIQLVIQNRFLTISQHWLNDGRHEHTSGLEDPPKSNVKSAYMWLYVPLLLIGVAATIVGYVGCFSVV
ncbi:hypothetical protein BDQ17DRAFT_190711 [Cyathus striatus]|nr:hypothetical protein BDQ17DRAFT_190711 [Cyathus striatus]